jgi:hypothetical protein
MAKKKGYRVTDRRTDRVYEFNRTNFFQKYALKILKTTLFGFNVNLFINTTESQLEFSELSVNKKKYIIS